MKNIFHKIKHNWKKIFIFIFLILFGFFFHIFIYFSGSITILTYLSAFLFLIFSFSIFKKFHKKFFYLNLFLILIQIIITFIQFPDCDASFKIGWYGCQCYGIKKNMLGGSQCIGKIKKCYGYYINPNLEKTEYWNFYLKDKYHPELEVSCDGFPEKLLKDFNQSKSI